MRMCGPCEVDGVHVTGHFEKEMVYCWTLTYRVQNSQLMYYQTFV